MKDKSIEHPIRQPAEPAASAPAPSLPEPSEWSHFLGRRPPQPEHAITLDTSPVPDWCNLGITLRVILGINLLFMLGLFLLGQPGDFIEQATLLAATLEPVLIASLLFGCALRRLSLKAPALLQITLALLLPVLLTWLIQNLLANLFEFTTTQILHHAVLAGVISALVLYWAHLRQLAYSPALSEARLQALQSRIRPHFLFNSLNAVLGLIRTQPRMAETALEDLADLFRILMRDSRERVPLREEVALCKQYLGIEALRLGARLRTEWHVDDSVTHALVPSLLLQPLIENAVHHGVEPLTEGGLITIAIRRSSDYVQVVISNPVRDQLATQSRLHTGNQIGLDNVRQRLALVHDLEARLDTAVIDGRFEVRIQFPIQ